MLVCDLIHQDVIRLKVCIYVCFEGYVLESLSICFEAYLGSIWHMTRGMSW
jgi:hypothetical protein